MKFINMVFFSIAWGTCPAMAVPSGPLFIDDSDGNIGTVDISTGTVTVLGNSGQELTDLGFTSDGKLYGTTFTGLYVIDKTSGEATLVSNYDGVGAGDMNALVGSGSKLFAGSGRTGELYAIDLSPYAITSLNGAESVGTAGDLAFLSTGGALYETMNNGNLDKITSIGASNVTSTTVGNMGNDFVYGLATGDDGVTYAVSGTEIYSVNLGTAALTPVLDYGGHGLGAANGTAFITEASIPVAIPEPRTLVLIGIGVLGLMIFSKRGLLG